jgi:oligopeptide transport system permease protein
LGPSFKYPGRTVNELIIDGFPASLQLGLLAVFWALIIGILAGVSAAMRPNTWSDYIPSSLSLFGICVPSMLLGPLLVLVFSLYWNWLPVSGWQSWEHRVLPSLTLGASLAAVISRLARSGMLDVLNQDYIRTARAKGAGPMRVLFLHALRGGILPVVSYLGPALASLIAGSFIVETVFQIPGVGRFFVQAATNRDYTVIMGTTIMLSVLIVFFITLSDIVSVWLNPRLSFEDGKGGRS